jgi:xanthine/CO dehydrogenase XdhC/CoxF family maturation factor
LPDALEALEQDRSQVKSYNWAEGYIEVLLEVIQPVPLLIFGAGYDAIPVARFAKALGWHVTVVDGRPAYAREDQFPDVDSVVLCPPESIRQHLRLNPRTVAIIMTHHYASDLELLRTLLPSPVRYIGILGPKRRTERLLQALQSEGLPITETDLQRVYSPVGLDVGAETPEEIALSILSEIQAVINRRSGDPLRNRKGGIHS